MMSPTLTKAKKTKRPDQLAALRDINRSLDKTAPKAARAWRDFWRSYSGSLSAGELAPVVVEGSTPQTLRADVIGAVDGFLRGDYRDLWNRSFDDGASYTEVNEEITAERDAEYGGWLTDQAVYQAGQQAKAWLHVVRIGRRADAKREDILEVARAATGLTPRDAKMVGNYQFMTMKKAVPKRTHDLVWQLLKNRAVLTAETQMALAYNNGKRLEYKRLLDLGLVPSVRREWVTAGDENVCKVCGPLGGVIRRTTSGANIYRSFTPGASTGGKGVGAIVNPPAHPRCRCTVRYYTDGG